MAFIKIQNLEFDKDGVVSRGTASIVDVSYVPGGRNHSRQSTRERLGKVISIAEDRKSGVFVSPTRGLVEYNAATDAKGNQWSKVSYGIRKGWYIMTKFLSVG